MLMLQIGYKCKQWKQQKQNNTSELQVINCTFSLIDVSAHSQLAKVALCKSTYLLVNRKSQIVTVTVDNGVAELLVLTFKATSINIILYYIIKTKDYFLPLLKISTDVCRYCL